MKLNCAILEDRPNSSRLLESQIYKLPSLQMVRVCPNLEELEKLFKEAKTELLFFVVDSITESQVAFWNALKERPILIFHPPHCNLAYRAFQMGALDYLTQPLDFKEFTKSIEKALNYKSFLQWNQTNSESANSSAHNYFFVKADYKIVKVNFEEILFIEGLGEYVRIYTENQKIVTLQTLNRLEKILPAANFTRIHRSHIINVDKINFIQNNIVSIGKYQLTISKSQKKDFLKIINKSAAIPHLRKKRFGKRHSSGSKKPSKFVIG